MMSLTPPGYHQFITRPVNGIDREPVSSSEENSSLSLRAVLNLEGSNAKVLSVPAFWNVVHMSLDHNVADCKCCRGKGVMINTTKRSCVLVIYGDLRELSPKKKSWPW
jgi:hypothetical protein